MIAPSHILYGPFADVSKRWGLVEWSGKLLRLRVVEVIFSKWVSKLGIRWHVGKLGAEVKNSVVTELLTECRFYGFSCLHLAAPLMASSSSSYSIEGPAFFSKVAR